VKGSRVLRNLTPFRYRPTGLTRDIFTVTGMVALRPTISSASHHRTYTRVASTCPARMRPTQARQVEHIACRLKA